MFSSLLLDVAPQSPEAGGMSVSAIIISLAVVMLLTFAILLAVFFLILVWRKRRNKRTFSVSAAEIDAVTQPQASSPNQP